MVIRISLVPLLSVAAFFYGNAQTIIRPGDKIIRTDLIRPSQDFYRCASIDASGKLLYDFVMEDHTIIDTPNRRIIFARYRQVPVGFFSTDTSVTDWTFNPVRMHEFFYQRKAEDEMTFGETEASVTSVRNGQTSVKTYPMKSGYFEDNMIEYIFGYLELADSTTYMLDNFNKDTPSPSDPYIVENAFTDIWNTAGGQHILCRVLHFTHGDCSGYFWINKETHQMIKEQATYVKGRYKGESFVLNKL